MRTITEALLDVEDIINYNMETLHKLAEIANTIAKDNPKEQEHIAKSMLCLWNYMTPVHRWIREQNPKQEAFYNELDKSLEEHNKRVSDVQSLAVSERPSRKGKK